MDKLIPKDPEHVMVIRDVTPNIVTCSVPFLRFGHIRIGGRGTIVRLTSGALAVFSPVALTPEVKSKLQTMGNDLKYIAATDIEHHIFVGSWHDAFPNAVVLGPKGLMDKRKKDAEMKDVEIIEFTDENQRSLKISDEFDRDFDWEYVHAHQNQELVFNYKPEKTLIEADLMFNLPATESYSKSSESAHQGILTKLFNGMQHTNGTAVWQKRFLWYGPSSGDRPAFNKSVERIAAWDFNRIIPCHGDVIEQNAKGIFQKVFEWHLQGKKMT